MARDLRDVAVALSDAALARAALIAKIADTGTAAIGPVTITPVGGPPAQVSIAGRSIGLIRSEIIAASQAELDAVEVTCAALIEEAGEALAEGD